MDIDTGAFQANLLGSSLAFAAPKLDNASLSGGLMRYHSAPSSVLAGLLDENFFSASEESEFARLLNDGIGSLSSVLDPRAVQQDGMNQAHFSAMGREQDGFLSHGSVSEQRSQYIGSDSNFHEHLSQTPLSAISEYGLEESVEGFCMPLSSGVVQPAPPEPGHAGTHSFKLSRVAELHGISFQSGLIRQSSSPSEALSRLVMDEDSDKVKLGCGLAGPHLPVMDKKLVGQSNLPTCQQVTTVNSLSDRKHSDGIGSISSPRRSNVLLRHSSSPAGLLSQINLEDFSIVKDKGSMEGTSGTFSTEALQDMRGPIFRRGHTPCSRFDNLADEAMERFIDLGQRKRGRGSDDKSPKGLVVPTLRCDPSDQRSPTDLGTMTMSSFSPPSNSSPGSVDCLEGAAEESVLCKARAKRGCATHPRSIAERERRIKISERMKKLQDLVPNLDKQASTAEMLDEVVEYVKLLQRQLQELSLNRPKCTGACQQQGGSPPQRQNLSGS